MRLRELVVIDPKVLYHERIVDKLPSNAHVVLLSGDTNGLDGITKILAREKDVRALRIISHGGPGRLFLNGEVIDGRTLARYTGTDVAASTDRTGGTEDRWTLEYATGPVEAPALRMTGYPYYLATYTVSDGDYISVADGNWSAATGLCSPASAITP